METIKKIFETKNGPVEGIQVKWEGFNILLVAGKKGFLGCPVFDMDAIDRYKVAAAIVESSPDNPIGTLERFPNRKIMKANKKAGELGIVVGMDLQKAFELIA